MKRKKIRVPIVEIDRPEYIIDTSFPPLQPLTRVYTNKPNLGLRGKISEGLWRKRQWKVLGMITGITTAYEAWQEVLLPDGTLAFYHQSELAPWRDDDGSYYTEPIVDPSNTEPCLVG